MAGRTESDDWRRQDGRNRDHRLLRTAEDVVGPAERNEVGKGPMGI